MDKITDLPVNYSKYLTNRRPQSVQSRPASSLNPYDQQQQPPQPQFSQTEPPQQYRTTTYNYPGLLFSLYNIYIYDTLRMFRCLYNNLSCIIYKSKFQSKWSIRS